MSTPTSGDLLLVNRGGVNYQIDYDDMSTLQDTDLLLVNRAGVNYQIAASDINLGPDGVILPSVDVLTPVNGAGLNEGDAYTPLSSAYVSTDSTPIYQRYFPELITTVSGGTWVNENNIFDGDTSTYAELTGDAYAVSQVVFTAPSTWVDGETSVYAANASGGDGGTIEVLDESDSVLRTYTLPGSLGETAIGIVRIGNKIRFTTSNQNIGLYLAHIVRAHTDYVINGRVAFEFTDDTDLDKMIAPIIQVDENGDVKVPTTSTVDSTTEIPGVNKSLVTIWYGENNPVTIAANDSTVSGYAPKGPRMAWTKSDSSLSYPGIADNVTMSEQYLKTSSASPVSSFGPILDENQSTYPPNNDFNVNGVRNYTVEIGVAPKVLDIVTWNGSGGSTDGIREIPHNLGTKPGMIIIKSVTSSTNWVVWHKDLAPNNNLYLNSSQQQSEGGHIKGEPTKEAFYVTLNGTCNDNGATYVAYVYASDTPGVQCGTYTGNGSGSGQNIPIPGALKGGFLLIKSKSNSTDWVVTTTQAAAVYQYWNPNISGTLQGTTGSYPGFLGSSGFFVLSGNSAFNQSSSEYVYLYVAEELTGPNSTQLNLLSGQDLEYFTTGTEITSNLAASGSNISFGHSYWYSPDNNVRQVLPSIDGEKFFDIRPETANKWMLWIKSYDKSESHYIADSERSTQSYLMANYSSSENYTTTGLLGPTPDTDERGYNLGLNGMVNQQGYNYIGWNFLAAPQFFDVQKFVGSGVTQTIQHDLGVEPGCMIIKRLDSNNDWRVYHHDLTSAAYQLYLNYDFKEGFASTVFDSTDPTSSVFTVGPDSGVNGSGGSYVAYLFAKDTPYVKCGKYTGAGGGTTVNVGFQPRWMLIKSTTLNGSDWQILDSILPEKTLSANQNLTMSTGMGWQFNSTGVYFALSAGGFSNSGDEYIYIAIADESEGHPPTPPSSSTVTETPDPNTATMVVNAESFDVGDSASAPALDASITSVAGTDGNTLLVDSSSGTWMPGLYAKGSETTVSAPSADEVTFTSTNAGTTPFSGVDATLSSRTWTLESGPAATGPWTVVDTYVDYDSMASQDGATPWSTNKPALAADTFYRVKVQYDSTNAESVESVYSTFKTSA